MNHEKAREYFSGYYEGTLERGLRQTLDQRLRTDAQLQAEYRAFERTMDQLDMLRFESIEVPSYLSDRIATRIEQAQAADKRSNPLMLWLPRFAVGGLAAAALLFGAISIFTVDHGRSQPSSIFPNVSAPPTQTTAPATWPPETVGVSAVGHSTQLHYQSATAHTVVVTNGGGQSETYNLAPNQQLQLGLNNPNDQASMFEVKVSENGPDEYIAVPGMRPHTESSDSGTVGDFAKALADKYNGPVILKVQDPGKTISWTLDSDNAKTAAQKSLDSESFDVTVTATNVVTISSK